MIKQLSDVESSGVCGGLFLRGTRMPPLIGREAFVFGTIMMGGITGLQSLVRETFEQGTGQDFTGLPGKTRLTALSMGYVGGLCIALLAKRYRVGF